MLTPRPRVQDDSCEKHEWYRYSVLKQLVWMWIRAICTHYAESGWELGGRGRGRARVHGKQKTNRIKVDANEHKCASSYTLWRHSTLALKLRRFSPTIRVISEFHLKIRDDGEWRSLNALAVTLAILFLHANQNVTADFHYSEYYYPA